jgi:hypothetical protein
MYYDIFYKMSSAADEIMAMKAEIDRLRKENAELKKSKGLDIQVTERGQVGIVFGTYTCRMYKSQWIKVFDNMELVKKFITDNDEDLA